jgi:hypothetical protein
MSYAAGVAPEALPVFQALEITIQELVLDLLDRIAADGPTLTPLTQSHVVVAVTGGSHTDVYLAIEVDHERQAVTLVALHWRRGRL